FEDTRGTTWMKYILYIVKLILEVIYLFFLLAVLPVLRLRKKIVDIGLGPLPLVNNIYHKRAFSLAGYSSETFVTQVWHITSDFDIRFDQHCLARYQITRRLFLNLYVFLYSALRYRSLVVYFDGGPFGLQTIFLWKFEPLLYKL